MPAATTERPRGDDGSPPLPAPRQRWALAGMAAAVVVLHVLGWGALLGLVAPRHFSLGSQGVYGVGIGVTAYTLGLRHAFDADHVAAIDNTTRKLVAEGRRPVSVGFWFSLGHSTVVLVVCALLAVGVRALAGQLVDGSSSLQHTAGVVGASVSGVFLWVIGLLNLAVLVSIVGVFRRMRGGVHDAGELEAHLRRRGLLSRLLSGATRAVHRPWHIYPVGVLFGLGFDTVTEVSLLVIAGGAAAVSLPWYAILTLPLLFTAGMCLLDSLDGAFMNAAYGWAASRPVRAVYYNITTTGLSVACALGIGTVELVSLLTDSLGIRTGPLAAVGALDLDDVGYGLVVLFVLAWAGALLVWRLGRIEERWTAAPGGPESGVVGGARG